MTDPVSDIARSVAERLVPERGPGLPIEVEAALRGRSPDRYIDPVAIGGLIVSVATLAWTVYKDLASRSSDPSPGVIARAVRVRLREEGSIGSDQERIVEVVVEETLKR